jgi:hypothetical protein
VLVFSQSLLSLDLIEEFLARASHETTADTVAGTYGTWIPGKDYYRLATPLSFFLFGLQGISEPGFWTRIALVRVRILLLIKIIRIIDRWLTYPPVSNLSLHGSIWSLESS